MSDIYLRLAAQSLKENRRISIPFVLGSSFVMALYFSIVNISVLPSVYENGQIGATYLKMTMDMGIVVIRIFLFILFFYLNSVWLKHRKQENGVLTMLGLDKKHLIRIQIYQMLICYVLSFVIGIPLGIGLSYGTIMILKWIMPSLSIDFLVSLVAIKESAIWIGACYLAITIYSAYVLIRTNPLEQVKKVGEKKIKNNWILAILSFLFLAAGYALALTIKDILSAVLMFFVAVTLVIIGTYLAFIFGSTVILTLLEKNRRYYYKTNHFLTVSTMKYRLKQNASSLATIAILSTMVLVTLSSTIALFAGNTKAINQEYPFAHTVQLQSYDEEPLEIEKFVPIVVDTATSVGLDPQTVVVSPNGYELTDAGAGVYLFDTSSAARFGLDPISLEAGQAIALSDEDPQTEFSVDGKNFEVAKWSEVSVKQPTSSMKYEYLIDFSKNGLVAPLYNIEFDGAQAAEVDEEREVELANTFAQALAPYETESEAATMMVRYMNKELSRQMTLSLFSGLLFVGIYLSLLFMVSVILMMYYKQISEGYEDHDRFKILQNVGLEKKQIRRVINSQVIAVFFLPLLVAAVHLSFAFPLINLILSALRLPYTSIFFWTCVATMAVFGVCYFVVYKLSARTYYQIATQ